MKSNEKNYIQRLQQGKEDALEYIIDSYLPLVKGTVYKVLGTFGDEGLIEECINDIFLSAWNNSTKFKGDANSFKSWLYIIAKFKAIDCYRSKIKNAVTCLDSIDITNQFSAEDDFISMENTNKLIKLINNMEPIDKEIFILKYFLGYKNEAIALKLNITKSSVDNRIYRGKRKLKEKVYDMNLEVV